MNMKPTLLSMEEIPFYLFAHQMEFPKAGNQLPEKLWQGQQHYYQWKKFHSTYLHIKWNFPKQEINCQRNCGRDNNIKVTNTLTSIPDL
ncbi:hypothetical protein VIGAN_03297100, partial [Vigna angularis var. angularis]